MATKNHITLGRFTAVVSFLIGTIMFSLYVFTTQNKLLFTGFLYIFIATVFNSIILFLLVSKANNDLKNRMQLLKTGGLLLLNIPILIIYAWCTLTLSNTMRISFKNATNHTLTKINIVGCNTEIITKLEPNQSTTVWIGISGDCSIHIDYLINGEVKSEIVAGYVSKGMGQKLMHQIGIENRIQL